MIPTVRGGSAATPFIQVAERRLIYRIRHYSQYGGGQMSYDQIDAQLFIHGGLPVRKCIQARQLIKLGLRRGHCNVHDYRGVLFGLRAAHITAYLASPPYGYKQTCSTDRGTDFRIHRGGSDSKAIANHLEYQWLIRLPHCSMRNDKMPHSKNPTTPLHTTQ